MRRRSLIATASLLVVLAFTTTVQAVGFLDSFDLLDPAWITDRYEPNGFVAPTFFDGDNRLAITITDAESASNRPGAYSSSFYNTQGRNRSADLSPGWEIFGSLYVSEDMLIGVDPRRTDLWGRTGTVGNETGVQYPIIGMINEGNGARWRWYDSDIGWIDLGDPVSLGWNDLAIRGDGNEFMFYLNGSLVATDNVINNALPDLTNVFLQAYNFGDGEYTVHWDNVGARNTRDDKPVPEPLTASMGIISLAGILVATRRRR